MSKFVEVINVPEDDFLQARHNERHEDGVEVPVERIDPVTLRNLITEFATREWEELGNSSYTLADKIEQVHRQLLDKSARVVYDLKTDSCNIVPTEGNRHV